MCCQLLQNLQIKLEFSIWFYVVTVPKIGILSWKPVICNPGMGIRPWTGDPSLERKEKGKFPSKTPPYVCLHGEGSLITFNGVSGWGPDTYKHTHTHTHAHKRDSDKGENAWGNTWHHNMWEPERAGSVCAPKGVKGGVGDWRWRGWRKGRCDREGFFSVWFTQLVDQETELPTVPFSPNSLTSCCCWNDVTVQLGMSRPHPHPLRLSPLSTQLQSLMSHCDLGAPMQHLWSKDTKSVKHKSLKIKLYRQSKIIKMLINMKTYQIL